MVEVCRDGRRVYLTNSLYAAWDAQFYPEGIDGWLVKLDAGEDGSLTLDPDVFVPFSGERPHQVRLQRRRRLVGLLLLPRLSMDGSGRCMLIAAARRLSRAQPRDGLAVRGRARDAGARPARRAARAGADRASATSCRSCSWRRLVLGLGLLADPSALRLGAGIALIAFGIFRFVKPRAHFRWTTMRVNRRELALVVVPDVERPRRRADGRAGADRRGRAAEASAHDHALEATGGGVELLTGGARRCCCTSARWSP